jgi:hypothetical protein
MPPKKRPEPRTLVQLVCPTCSKPDSHHIAGNYYGTTLPLGVVTEQGAFCPNCETALAEIGRTKEG